MDYTLFNKVNDKFQHLAPVLDNEILKWQFYALEGGLINDIRKPPSTKCSLAYFQAAMSVRELNDVDIDILFRAQLHYYFLHAPEQTLKKIHALVPSDDVWWHTVIKERYPLWDYVIVDNFSVFVQKELAKDSYYLSTDFVDYLMKQDINTLNTLNLDDFYILFQRAHQSFYNYDKIYTLAQRIKGFSAYLADKKMVLSWQSVDYFDEKMNVEAVEWNSFLKKKEHWKACQKHPSYLQKAYKKNDEKLTPDDIERLLNSTFPPEAILKWVNSRDKKKLLKPFFWLPESLLPDALKTYTHYRVDGITKNYELPAIIEKWWPIFENAKMVADITGDVSAFVGCATISEFNDMLKHSRYVNSHKLSNTENFYMAVPNILFNNAPHIDVKTDEYSIML